MTWLLGFTFSTVMAGLAYRLHALSKSGLAGAIFVGTCIFGVLGWWGILVLAFFFVSSSLLSKFPPSRAKSSHPSYFIVAKGARRDIAQVLANGGVAAILSLAYAVTHQELFMIMFSASLAAATADTWASEIGKWSKAPPRDCLTWKRVAPGTSGAVSFIGTVASVAGALCTALLSLPLLLSQFPDRSLFELSTLIACSGWVGNWIDTVIGGLLQIRYTCTSCGQETEQTVHCSVPTKPVRGVFWVNNDTVNLLCTLSSALLSWILLMLL